MPSDPPLVTIAITTRNRPEMARRALATALAQTVKDLEVIVVDDASEEPFLLDDADPRIRLVRLEVRAGLSGARNAALHRARGTWITHLDDDDELLPQMAEVSLEAARSSTLPKPVAVVSAVEHVLHRSGRVEVVTPFSLPRGSHFLMEESTGEKDFARFMPGTLFVEAEVLRGLGGWDESLPSWEYDDMFFRLNPVCSIQGLDTVTCRVHAHGGARLSQSMPERAEAMQKIVEKHHAMFVQHPRKYATYLRGLGRTHLAAGRWAPAVRATSRSLRYDPLRLKGVAVFLLSLAGPRVYRAVLPVLLRFL